MKKKIDIRIFIILILLIILGFLLYLYFKEDNSEIKNINQINFDMFKKKDSTITMSSVIKSSLEEKLELHNTYKLKKSYIEKNKLIKKGDKLIEYTNGKYLVAPYDLIINDYNVPSKDKECNSSHYIKVMSSNSLMVQLDVDESKIKNFELGKSVNIKISSLDNKEYEGIITKINNIAQNGKFKVNIELINDGNVLIGMSCKVTI